MIVVISDLSLLNYFVGSNGLYMQSNTETLVAQLILTNL